MGKRRFMAAIAFGLSLLMLIVAATPLSQLILAQAIGVSGEVLARSVEVILVMCLLPVIIVTRNYYHGLLMHRRATRGMAVGATLRVVGIFLLANQLLAWGWLDHVTAAAVLLTGFGIETVTVIVTWQRQRRVDSPA